MRIHFFYFALVMILLSACATPFSKVKPKKPNSQEIGVEVVEKVPLKETQVEPIQDGGVVTNEPKKHLSKAEAYLKTPEPFSLESHEEDPELLGPQTTLKKPLLEKEEEAKEALDSNTTTLESNSSKRKKQL